MSTARMKDQEDFDLERFVDMFDKALTSKDERVVNALRSLMMMVILTSPEDGSKQMTGPFKRMMDDHNNIFRRLEQMDHQLRQMQSELAYGENRYSGVSRHLRDKEQYFKWPAQYPTWDLNYTNDELKNALNKINGQFATTATQTNQIQPQPSTKGNKNGK